MIPDFEVHTHNRDGHAMVFVSGEIDLPVGDRFRDALASLRAIPPTSSSTSLASPLSAPPESVPWSSV